MDANSQVLQQYWQHSRLTGKRHCCIPKSFGVWTGIAVIRYIFLIGILNDSSILHLQNWTAAGVPVFMCMPLCWQSWFLLKGILFISFWFRISGIQIYNLVYMVCSWWINDKQTSRPDDRCSDFLQCLLFPCHRQYLQSGVALNGELVLFHPVCRHSVMVLTEILNVFLCHFQCCQYCTRLVTHPSLWIKFRTFIFAEVAHGFIEFIKAIFNSVG